MSHAPWKLIRSPLAHVKPHLMNLSSSTNIFAGSRVRYLRKSFVALGYMILEWKYHKIKKYNFFRYLRISLQPSEIVRYHQKNQTDRIAWWTRRIFSMWIILWVKFHGPAVSSFCYFVRDICVKNFICWKWHSTTLTLVINTPFVWCDRKLFEI